GDATGPLRARAPRHGARSPAPDAPARRVGSRLAGWRGGQAGLGRPCAVAPGPARPPERSPTALCTQPAQRHRRGRGRQGLPAKALAVEWPPAPDILPPAAPLAFA